jgi:ElaB/YqjD/DUF883 family membrane-anchored ribosome-binding protein
MSAGSVKKVARRVVKKAAKRTESALAVVADRLPSGSRVVKRASATLKTVPSRAKRFIKSNPVRVILGASAIGFVLAKLKHLV